MTLPASVPRCPGMPKAEPGNWPFPQPQPDCLMQCERRRQGIADYMAGTPVQWMAPPPAGPCGELLRAKR